MSPLPHDSIYDSIHLYTVRSQRGGLRERSRLNKTISKLARNELTRHAAIRPNREGHIFDYFCVVGYPPAAKVEIKASAQARRQEPVILYQYPEDNQLNEQVVHFCFPNGVTPTVSLRKKTADQKTATLELANCTMKELKDSERSFLFLMTGNGALLYGICVSQNELLSCLEKPSFFKQPAYNPPSPLSPTELRYEVSAPRVYCLLSRFPFFKLHFNVLYTLLETERTMQREARERARMQSGMASKTEQASTTTTRANSISSEVEATKDHDKEKDKDKEDEREKKGGAWNWRWRWGKDKDKKDSKDGSNKDASKDPAPKMARTSSAHSLSNWTVKKTIKDDIIATKAESSTSITTALVSPRRGRAISRGAPEKPDTTLSSTKDEGETTPRGRSATTTKNESDAAGDNAAPSARKRSNSRVRSLFALGANKIERGEIVSTIGDESGNAQPQAAEAEEASPFPGIRLHQNHEAEETTGPFPGIRLRTCKEAASEDQATHSNAVAGAADAELGDDVTTPAAGARRRADTDDQSDSSKEKNKVVALLEAYYNTNIRSTLGSFTVKLPSAKRHGKFVCPEGDEEKLIMEWCAPTMLRLVPLPNIIMLMRALLQEYKIVLLCKNLGVLSFIAMALLPLLRPFEWQGPFIPLVPKNLEECVESPVPCVLGMPTTCEEDLIPVVMDDCLIVNIETEQVVLPERPLAPLPNEEDFYAQLGVYHSKIYRPVNSPDRDTAFHRPAKSTDEEQAVAAGFLSLVRSYQERLVQEIVNYAHIHCISESSPAPSLPSLPLSASPSLSAPCLPSVTSPSVTSAAYAGSVTTSFSPLASSASYTSLTTFEQAELEETLSHAYAERHHYAGAAAMNYVRPPPLSPTSGASPQRRHFQLPAVHSYSLALPTIRELDSDDDSGGGGAKSDDEGRLESTPFNLASSPSGGGGKKDPAKRRLLMDDHEQWARTRSDNGDEVVSAKVALGCSDVVDLSSSAGGKGNKTKQGGGKTKGKAGRRKGHGGGEGGFAAASALIQTLPHNRELEDIKAQVEIDRVSSDEIKGMQKTKAKTKSEKNEDDSEGDEEGESSTTTASLRTHPMRTSKNLSFSASSIPAFVESTSPDPNPPAPINLAQFIDGQTGGTKNESEGSGRMKVAIPTLPIRVRGATPLSTSDQPMQPGSSSPTHSPPSSPKFGGGGSASGADDNDNNADGAPQLILSLRPSVPPLSSHLPQLAASSFDWTDMNSLKKLVCLFPVTQQKFISNFLFTQHFTMFTERLAKIFGEKRSRQSNVITPRSAARFLDQLKKMIDQEEGQATMARSLLQIYTMLEEQKEVVGGGGASDETTGDHQHQHAVGSPPVDHHSLAVPQSQSQQPNRKSVLGISLASSSDFGMGKVKEAIKHSGSSIGVRGEVAAAPSGHSGHSSSLSVSPAASAASPVGAVKRPGHRRQGSVGGQEILKIKPEEEIEGEVGKEQKNMEQIIKLSDERLRILTRSKDTLKALFNSDSPTSTQQSSPLTFVASGGGEATSSSLSSTTVSPSTVSIPSPRSANGASLIPAAPPSSPPPSSSSSLSTSTSTTSRPSTKALLSPRRQQDAPQINIVVTGDRDSVESEDSQEADDRRKGNKKIRGRAGARRASLGGNDDQQQLSPRSRGPEVETDAQRRLRSPSDSP
ncbi:DENN (AEX3) domain containing protein [Acanthamoeba castellanii str. Neff]|uniref:DENN (AEX3) domain containing protein n=1 Tax=Acanthamoeba castellanii (strain ATCC 30010 / Neff) TaxID=1257118 RepID=L8GG93_ACACF|nr:DENN (AEX3) domain containing protein [Acanthamoeba castellanii str. Neff]ELR11201.1 DENN (AEX3) domain containing protein [Acanthamoeba castellanii str. Neff]